MPKQIKINDYLSIGGPHTFIIAEIGSNHNQSFELACETIDAACEAGVDAVKFQSIRLDKLYLDPTPQTVELHRKIDFPEDWHAKLNEYCKHKGVLFFSSPTYLESIDLLEEIDVSIYKLASAQVGTFPQIVEAVIATGKPVILSTGIVNMLQLEKVIQLFETAGHDRYAILHCNSIYPTPNSKVHLPLINTYRKKFRCWTGYSDHTVGIVAAVAAVAHGAKVIEKHFTLSRELPVPDAPFSLVPKELKEMVSCIRATEEMLGDSPRRHIEDEESDFKKNIGTKLVLKSSVPAGKPADLKDFVFLRAKVGVCCSELEGLLKRKATYRRGLQQGHLLSERDLRFTEAASENL